MADRSRTNGPVTFAVRNRQSQVQRDLARMAGEAGQLEINLVMLLGRQASHNVLDITNGSTVAEVDPVGSTSVTTPR